MTEFTISMLCLYIVCVFQTCSYQKAASLLNQKSNKTDKLLSILGNIYEILPIIVFKYNPSTKKIKEVKDGITNVFKTQDRSTVV